MGLLVCRTGEPEARHRNLTAFALPMHSPGVTVRPIRQMTGGASFNEVFFDDVRIPDELRLGEVDKGWDVVVATLMNERAAVGAPAAGGSGILSAPSGSPGCCGASAAWTTRRSATSSCGCTARWSSAG